MNKRIRFLNIVLKILILLLVAHAIIYSELTQYQNKGMNYRLIGYPLAAFSVVITRYLSKQRGKYPYSVDIFISLIIALDMLGNALGYYGSVEWWDDVMHLINCALLAIVLIRLLRSSAIAPAIRNIIVIGIISWLQIVWEIAEYAIFLKTNSYEMPTAYRDTIGDLFIGQIGVIAAVLLNIYIDKVRAKSQIPLKQPIV